MIGHLAASAWEYGIIYSGVPEPNDEKMLEVLDILNDAGKDGWELIGFMGPYAILKRTIQEEGEEEAE